VRCAAPTWSLPRQGPEAWASGRTGDAARDLPLLHAASCEDPEAFWGAVLRRLRVRFTRQPARCAGMQGPCPRVGRACDQDVSAFWASRRAALRCQRACVFSTVA